jgi:hypothetical protein
MRVEEPDPLRFIRQIRVEAELLRAVRREADIEVATIVAAARTKRELEQLRHERPGARSSERAGDRREDR